MANNQIKFLAAAVAAVKFSNTLIGEFCDDAPFNKLNEEPLPNLQQSIPTMNLPGCNGVVLQATSVQLNSIVFKYTHSI